MRLGSLTAVSTFALLASLPLGAALSTETDEQNFRHSAWWRPVGCGNSTACQATTLASLRKRFGSWDTYSPTVARVYNGSKAIVTQVCDSLSLSLSLSL